MPLTRDVLTPQEVAEYLQLAPDTVYRYIRERDRNYVVRELDDLIAMHKAGRLMAHLMSDAGRRGQSGK